jgi:phosphoglycolate phosphatase-like HAD superfamily hydrolase
MTAAILTDLDGVLLDSEATVRTALAALATAVLGRRITTADLPADAATTRHPELLKALGAPPDVDICTSSWDAALAAASTNGIPLISPVADGLRACRSAGIATGLVTLQSRTRLPWLLPQEILAHIECVVCWEDAPPKPSPDGLLFCLTQLEADRDEAVFLGDTPGDMTAALEAGITPIGVAWGYADAAALLAAGAAIVLHDPAEVGPDLLHLTPRPTSPIRTSQRAPQAGSARSH